MADIVKNDGWRRRWGGRLRKGWVKVGYSGNREREETKVSGGYEKKMWIAAAVEKDEGQVGKNGFTEKTARGRRRLLLVCAAKRKIE